MTEEELDKSEKQATRVGAINTTPERTQALVSKKMLAKGEKEVAKQAKALERLKVEYVSVEFLKPNAYNPNRQNAQDFDLLCRSMEEDGFTQPVLALPSGMIIDGEHRWRAAIHLGYTKIPVVFADMTAEQMRISTLRHNRARGTEDIELTASLLKDLEKLGALEYAKSELLLNEEEIGRFLSDTKAPEGLAGEEFAEAWEYQNPHTIDGGGADVITFTKAKGSQILVKHSTAEVQQKYSDYEMKMKSTISDGEEKKVLKEKFTPFRIAFMFVGAEALFVAKVLGEKPSEMLYSLCEAEYALMKERGEFQDPEIEDVPRGADDTPEEEDNV